MREAFRTCLDTVRSRDPERAAQISFNQLTRLTMQVWPCAWSKPGLPASRVEVTVLQHTVTCPDLRRAIVQHSLYLAMRTAPTADTYQLLHCQPMGSIAIPVVPFIAC